MAAALLIVYVALSFLNDTGGFLGTDTGGKVATLEAMSVRHEAKPDVGYWAQEWDPKGDLHPLFDTTLIKGRWLQVSTLPVLYAALPLFNLLGYRGALLLPMLGSVAAALAARALAQRLGAQRPWAVFWLVGLASPITVYALDFWEHSIGVALLLWAAVALYDAVAADRPRRSLIAGALIGSAFLLRTEALVYGGMGAAIALVLLYRRRRQLAEAMRFSLQFAVGAAIAVGLGTALELATVGRSLRFARASGAAVGAGSRAGVLPGSRVSDAIATTVNLRPSLDWWSYAEGAAVVVMIVVIVVALSTNSLQAPRERRALSGFAILIAGLYVLRFGKGLGFVPGLFAATPVAAVAVGLGWQSPKRRVLTAAALGALPFMWMFQFVGGAAPQWGGRYELTTTMLLLAVGAVTLESLPLWVGRSLIVLSVAVTAFGVLWLGERSHSIADAMVEVRQLSQPVVVSDVTHLFREGGAFYDPDRRWLTATDPSQLDHAAEVVRLAGYAEFALITDDSEQPREFEGYRRGATQKIELFSDLPLRVTTYEATSGP